MVLEPLLNVVSPILAGPMSPLVMKPHAPRPNPAIYPGGGGPKFGLRNTIRLIEDASLSELRKSNFLII